MIEENVEFLEEYKKLDTLIKDIFHSEEGVSEYIRYMDEKKLDWNYEDFYKTLKHLRWIRNKLTHEPETMKQDLCDSNDIEDVKGVYEDIMQMKDPRNLRIKIEQEKAARAKQKNVEIRQNDNHPLEHGSSTGFPIGLLVFFIVLVFMIGFLGYMVISLY